MAVTANMDNQLRTALILYVQIYSGVYPTKLLRIDSTLFAPSALSFSSSWHVYILQQRKKRTQREETGILQVHQGYDKKKSMTLVWLFVVVQARMRAFSNAVFRQRD